MGIQKDSEGFNGFKRGGPEASWAHVEQTRDITQRVQWEYKRIHLEFKRIQWEFKRIQKDSMDSKGVRGTG